MAKSLILKELALKLGISITALEREIGVSAATITKSIDRNADISPLLYNKISTKYPNINSQWLTTGEGEIFLSNTTSTSLEKNRRRVPLIGEAAAGTEMEINVYDRPYEMEYIDVGDLLRDSEAAFTVYGNSMNPNYPSGCILGIKRNNDTFIQPGEIYLLVTRSNRVFKRLYYNDDKTGFICFSDNTMEHEKGRLKGQPYYPPFEVKASEVITTYDVVGMIKRTRNSGVIMRQS